MHVIDVISQGGIAMSVENPAQGEVFTVRSYKQYSGVPWANTYEIRCTADDATRSDLVDAALAIVNAERNIHWTGVNFYRVVVSTYQPDSRPYNPSAFTTVDLSLQGNVSLTGDVIPLSQCVFARFTAEGGRSGKRFYRGCLAETDVGFGFKGHFVLEQRRNSIQAAIGVLAGNFSANFEMVLARGTPTPTNVRRVNLIRVAEQTSHRKLDNRYFDMRMR